MILGKKIFLTGNMETRILTILKMAGWFENRRVDISEVNEYYKRQNIPLVEPARRFFQEYYGLAGNWYLTWNPSPMHSLNPGNAPDFCFDLYPDDPADSIECGYQQQISEVANENISPVGEIGYYYPAEVWIGQSGKFYCVHDYDDSKIQIHDNLLAFLKQELSHQSLESVTITYSLFQRNKGMC